MAFGLDLGNLIVHLRLDTTQYDKIMREAGRRIENASRRMTSLGRTLSFRVTAPIVAMGAASVKAFSNFDDAMTKSLAIMQNITPGVRREMEALALTISTNGVTSATDLAKSYFFLASAGLDAKQSMAALNAVNQFAIAGNFDMATATDLATDAQSALGLTVKDAQKNLKGMTRVTDVLVGANTLANATVEQFSKSLTSEAGPAMKAYGIELEEGVAVLAAFADQGIKGEKAGSLFSRMLRLMTKGFLANEQAWKRFNINIFDANQNLKPLHEIVGDISGAMENMSPKLKFATLDMLGFQARSQQAILPLIGLQDKIKEYNEALQNMGGITDEVANKNMKSFASQITILKNKFVAIGIGIGNILAPSILAVSELLQIGIQRWNELNTSTQKYIVSMLLLTATVGPLLFTLGSLLKTLLLLKVASLAFAGSISILKGSILGLYAGVVGFSLGTFLFNEFTFVQESATVMVKFLEKAWVRIGFAFKQMVAGIQVVWEDFSTVFRKNINDIQTGIPLALGGITETTARLRNKLIDESRIGAAAMLKNTKDLKIQLQDIDNAYTKIINKIRSGNFVNDAASGNIIDTKAIEEATKALQDFIDGIDTGAQQFDTFASKMQDWKDSASDVAVNVADVFTNAFDQMSRKLADFLVEGEANFASFAKAVLKDLLAILIRAQIVIPLATSLGFFSGGGPQVQAGIPTTPAGIAHGGGMVGSIMGRRNIPSALFAGAPRLHNGLASDEFPTILQRGETVIPRGGGTGGSPPNVIINNETGTAFKQQGAPTFDGKEWVISIVTEDIEQFGTLRQVIGGIGRG